MWKKGAAAGLAVALLLAALVLLRRVSDRSGDESPSVVAKRVEPRASNPPARVSRASTVDVVGSRGSDGPPAAELRGPSAGVWAVLEHGHPSAHEQRDALVAAFKAAPPCSASWCDDGRATLAAWQAAIAAKLPGAMTADAIECSAAGCWMKIVAADPGKWRDIRSDLPAVTAEKSWPGASIQGGPDFQPQGGAVISMWAILPNVDSKPSQDDKGVDQ